MRNNTPFWMVSGVSCFRKPNATHPRDEIAKITKPHPVIRAENFPATMTAAMMPVAIAIHCTMSAIIASPFTNTRTLEREKGSGRQTPPSEPPEDRPAKPELSRKRPAGTTDRAELKTPAQNLGEETAETPAQPDKYGVYSKTVTMPRSVALACSLTEVEGKGRDGVTRCQRADMPLDQGESRELAGNEFNAHGERIPFVVCRGKRAVSVRGEGLYCLDR
jgi:hypothetical protein